MIQMSSDRGLPSTRMFFPNEYFRTTSCQAIHDVYIMKKCLENLEIIDENQFNFKIINFPMN